MLILALESSAKPASVAACLEGKLLGQYFQNNGFSHSRTLLTMAQALMKNLDIHSGDIDLIAVAHGPGSFTGVRIGVSAAKGLAWGFGVPVCGVSTLEAMAYGQGDRSPGLVCPVMDARRNQVYNALFKRSDEKLTRLTDDRAISLEELATELMHYTGMPIMLVGDGAAIAYDYLKCNTTSECDTSLKGNSPSAGTPSSVSPPSFTGHLLSLVDTPELLRYQTAYGVALAALNTEPIPAVDLEPYYLRPSQAERLSALKNQVSGV